MKVLLAALAFAWPFGGWHVAETIDGKRFEAFDAASLNLHDFDRDGKQEIVAMNDNGHVYVISATSGRVLADVPTTHPDGWAARDINPVAIGDLYGDGTSCMVIPNSAAYVAAWCYGGKGLFGLSLTFEKRWEVRADAAAFQEDFLAEHPWLKGQQPGIDGNAFLSDVDGDGTLEVFTQTDGYPGQFSFSHDGKLRWLRAEHDGNAGAQVADLDGNGRKEVVFATDAGFVAVFDADHGTPRWSFDAKANGADPGSIPVPPTLADLDGDGRLEIVFGARHAVEDGPGWEERSHARFFALSSEGRLLWRASHEWMNPLTYTRPVPFDVDGDGVLDVIALDWNTVGHKPGNWETTARPPNLFALSGRDGKALWHKPISVYWSNKDIVLLDDARIIVNMEKDGKDGLGVFDARDGKELAWHAVADPPWEVMRGPVAGDVDGDGDVDIIVPIAHRTGESARGLDVGQRAGALKVIDTRDRTGVIEDGTSLHTDAASDPLFDVTWITGWRGAVTAGVVGVAIALALTFGRRHGV